MKRSMGTKSIVTALALCAVLCAALCLSACAGESPAVREVWQEEPEKQEKPEEAWQDAFEITREDERTEPGVEVEKIDLDGRENRVVIEKAGDIWLSGSLEGQIVVNVCGDELVHLYLAGVSISSGQGPAILIEKASKVIVTLVSETENALSDSSDYRGYEETKGCLYCAADLTINGAGSLSVAGFCEDGIRSRDVVRILGSNVDVQAKGDGIRGNDGIVIKESRVKVESEGNGIRTADRGKGTKGVIEISGGSLNVIAGKNGIYAASDLHSRDCSLNVNAVEEKTRAEGTETHLP